MENCQVGVFLSDASAARHALIDRELYLPRSWTADPGRCSAAGIPDGTAFATKPKLARVMIGRALDAGTSASWVTADKVYGADPCLRTDLERHQMSYVPAVVTTHRAATGAGTCLAGTIARRLPPVRRSGTRPARAPRATAGMTGPGPASTPGVPGAGSC